MFGVFRCCCASGDKQDVEIAVESMSSPPPWTTPDPDNSVPAALQLSRDDRQKWIKDEDHGAKAIVTGVPVDLGALRKNSRGLPTSPDRLRDRCHNWGPTSATFEVTLVKHSGDAFGLDLNPHDGVTLLIGQVKHGLVEDWNTLQGDTAVFLVSRGDRIVAVNGVLGDSGMLLETMKVQSDCEVFTLTVSRLMEFRVTWNRRIGQSLGLDLAPTNAAGAVEFVLVKQVRPGPAQDANEAFGPEMECRCGDRILEVNGIEGDETHMLKMLAQEASLNAVLRRPPLAVLSA